MNIKNQARIGDQDFDWTLVRSFLAVLESGSLLGAARRLQVSQPTIGRHIEALEAQLGLDLFERTGRGMEPTAAAGQIADHARTMQAGADQLVRSVTGGDRQAAGLVRISASTVVAQFILPECIRRLRDESPQIDVAVVATDEVSNLLRRDADIAIRMVRPVQSSLIVRRLGQFPLVPCASVDYLARYGSPRTPVDLINHRIIGPDRDKALLTQMAGVALGTGTDPDRLRLAVRSDHFPVQIAAMNAGLGIGFTTRQVIARHENLRALSLKLPIPPLPVWLAVHREIRSSVRIRRVFDSLADTLKAQSALAG